MNKFKKKNNTVGFHFINQLPFPVIKGLGYQQLENEDYFWDNSHRRDSHCILQFTISGVGMLHFHQEAYKQEAGDLFIIETPDNSQYFLPSYSDKWEFIYFEFSKEALPIIFDLHHKLGPSFSIKDQPDLINKLYAVYQELSEDTKPNFTTNSRVTYDLLMDLLTLVENQDSNQDSLEKVKFYLEKHYQEANLSLDDIADFAKLSKFHLTRTYQKKFGISIFGDLKQLRLNQACMLLKQNNDLSIKEIAYQVGYSSDNYFCKVFKKELGQTPKQFRLMENQYDVVKKIYRD